MRPVSNGLEWHLAMMQRELKDFAPSVIVVDPVTSFFSAGQPLHVNRMLMRLIDIFKSQGVTSLFTSLTHGGESLHETEVGISSLMDTWLLLEDVEGSGERNRCLSILKSRGMAHSNQVREFRLTNDGIELLDVYVGAEGVLTGAARTTQEARESAAAHQRQTQIENRRRELERKRLVIEAQVAALRADFDAEEEEVTRLICEGEQREKEMERQRAMMALIRQSDALSEQKKGIGHAKGHKNNGREKAKSPKTRTVAVR